MLGSVRGIKQSSMVEYCDTPHIEREEKQGTQSIPKEGSYDIYSTICGKIRIFSGNWRAMLDKKKRL